MGTEKRLIELLDETFDNQYDRNLVITARNTADHLLANGVTFAKDTNVPSWIPVTERLPDHFGVFIVAIKEPFKERVGKDCADFDPLAKKWLTSLHWDKGYKVTHWMELPEPPKEDSHD